jgi:hypothetical protein
MRPLHSIFLLVLSTAFGACAQNGAQSGPMPANPSAASQARTSRVGWISAAARAKNAPLLYVASYFGNAVDIFPEYGKNAPPIGQITDGINKPYGMAVDRHGDLFVTNSGSNTVTVYPRGSTSPSKTYSIGLQYPLDVAVGDDGTVYVSCYRPGFVVEYAPDDMNPSRTISVPNAGPFGIALDASNNLYINFPTLGVLKYARGSGSLSGTNLGIILPEQGNSRGIAFDRAGDLLIAVERVPYPGSVYVYPPGSNTPSTKSITSSFISEPAWLAFDRSGERLFLSDDDEVHEYRFSDGKALTSEKQGTASAPSGVAVDPPERL